MSTQAATVVSLQGKAWAKDADGNLREVSVGDVIAADEQLVTEAETRVELDFGDASPVTLAGAHDVAMSPDLWPETATSEAQGSVMDQPFEAILASLEENDQQLQQLQFEEIYSSLQANDALLGATPFEVLVSALEVNEELLQDTQFAQLYATLEANENLLKGSDFSTIYATLAENDALLQDARIDSLFASLQANEQALLAGDGDLLEALDEAPAAGGQGSEGGSSFVRLTRINETVSDPTLNNVSSGSAQEASQREGDFPVNAAPGLVAQSYSTTEDTPLQGLVDASDPDNDSLTFTLVGQPANGQIELDPQTGSFVYTPAENFNGEDSFVVEVSDGQVTTTETMTVEVTPVNDAPQSEDDNITTPEDTPISGQVEADDVDLPEGDVIAFALTGDPENGSVTLDPETGAYTYIPAENFNGNDSFTVTVTDTSGATSTSVINVTVTPVNDAPEARDDGPLETAAGFTTTGNALDNDFDIDSAPLSVTGFVIEGDDSSYSAGDTVVIDGVGEFSLLSNGDFSFTPSAGYSGEVPEVTYTVTDGELSDSAVIRFDHVPGGGVNPPPPPPPQPEASIALNAIAGDNVLNAEEASGTVVITGVVGGDVRPGDTVTLTIGGTSVTGTVGSGGTTFAISVAGSLLAANSSISATVTGQDELGSNYSATDSGSYAVDTGASASIAIDPVTGDNIINAEEATNTQTITGSVAGDASVGDTVTLTVNGTLYTGVVADDNTFAIEVSGADLAVDTQVSGQVSGSDDNGNPFVATDIEVYEVDTTLPEAQLDIDPVADANAVAKAAALGETTQVSGSVGGDVQDGDTVTITLAGNDYTGQASGGRFDIEVSAQDFIDDSDSSISGSVVTFDTAGNSASANDEEAYDVEPVQIIQFTDNFVNGLSYQTSSGLTGTTGDAGSAGSFFVRASDTIKFTLGDVTVAEFSASAISGNVLFLQDIAGVELSDSNTNYVENMAIFLQALDNDLTDTTPDNGVLNTNSLTNTDVSYGSNINLDASLHDLFSGYIDPTTGAPLNIATAGKEMISLALAHAGVEFTRDTERDPSNNNVFETIAMEHVADTIDQLAGDRGPVTTDERTPDVLDVPGGQVQYNYSELNGEITFTTADLLEGAVGRQVITENLLVKNVSLSAGYEGIGTLVDRGDGNYAIELNDGIDQYDLEGLAIDYRVEDWTAFREVTSDTQDQYRSHLSANIPDVNEGDGFNEFTLNSELTFDTDQTLLINFTSELLSAQLGIDIAEYADDYLVPIEYSNNGGQTWQAMGQHSIDYSQSLPRPIFSFTLAAGSDSVDIRVPIFDDAKIEPTEYFDAYVSGDNVYDEHLQFAIFDNDAEGELPQISIDYVVVVENQGQAVFTLSLDRPSNDTVSVEYNTADLAAIAGQDYIASNGTVTFQPGETTATIVIDIIDDEIVENNPDPELALINLSNPENANLADAQGTLRIFDNDGENNTEIGLDIDPVTGDNLIDAAEAGQTVTVTGNVSAPANINFAIVILTINGETYQTTTDGNGAYAINVPGSELTLDDDTTIDGIVYGFGPDGAKGTAIAQEVYDVNLDGPGISINDENGAEAGEQTVLEASGDSVSGSANVSATAGIKAVAVGNVDITGASASDPVEVDGAYGTLSITGYDANTGEITYIYTENGNAEDHTNGDESVIDQFTISVTDNADANTTDVLDILIGDTAPVAVADSFEGTEDQVLSGDVSNNDTASRDGNLYSVEEGDGPANGSVSMNADGTFDYTPDANYNGSDSFTYTVTDEDGDVRTAVVDISVSSDNDQPESTSIEAQSDNDADVIELDVSGSFSDADNDTLTYSVSGLPAGLDIDSATGVISGTIDNSASQGGTDGVYSVTVTASDGASETSQTFNWSVGNPGPDFINENTSEEDTYAFSANEGTVADTVVGTAGASDPDGDELSYSITAGNEAGLFAIDTATGAISVTKDIDDADLGNYTLTVLVNDGEGGTDEATVEIDLNNVNDTPTATSSSVQTDEDVSYVFSLADFSFNDADDDPLVSVTIGTVPSAGVGVLQYFDGSDWISVSEGQVVTQADIASNNLRYEPTPNTPAGTDSDAGIDSFTFSVSDGTESSGIATMTVSVVAVADTPELTLDDVPTDVSNDSNFSLPTGNGLTLNRYDNVAGLVVDQEGESSAILESTLSGLTPDSTQVVDQLGVGTQSGDGVNLSENDALSLEGLIYLEAGSTYEVTGYVDDTLHIEIGGDVVYSEGDNTYGTFSSLPQTFSPEESGYYSFELYAYNAHDIGSISALIKENGGAAQSLSNFLLFTDIQAVDDANGQYSDYIGDSDGGYYPVRLNEGLENTPIQLQDISAELTDTDGSETLSISISDLPDGSVLSDGVRSFTANDVNGYEADVTGWTLSTLTITPPADFFGYFDLNVTATSTESSNDDQASTTESFRVIVREVVENSMPTAVDDAIVVAQNTIFTGGDVSANDTLSADGGNTYSLQTGPQNGSLTLNSDGTFTYAPDSDYAGSDSFVYTITDTDGDVDTATVNILVPGLNDNSAQVMEEALPGGTNSGSDEEVATGNLLGDDSALPSGLSLAVSIALGSVTSSAGQVTVTTAEGNTLVVNTDSSSSGFGDYTYTLNNPVDHNLASHSFDAGTNGWSGTGVSSNSEGRLEIAQDATASQTFSFGSEMRGQVVTLNFGLIASVGWEGPGENNQDFLEVYADGALINSTSLSANESAIVSVSVTLDNNGEVELGLTANTTGGTEVAFIENLSIDAVSLTDQFTYTLTDGNGYIDSAQLNVEIFNDLPDVPSDQGEAVTIGEDDDLAFGGGLNLLDNTVSLTGVEIVTGISNIRVSPDSDPSEFTILEDGSPDDPNTPEVEVGRYLVAHNDGYRVGELVVREDGEVSFINTNEHAFDYLSEGESAQLMFDYDIEVDGQTLTSTATINVQGENDAPVANDDTGIVEGSFFSEFWLYDQNESQNRPNLETVAQVLNHTADYAPDAIFQTTGFNYTERNGDLGGQGNLDAWLGDDADTLDWYPNDDTRNDQDSGDVEQDSIVRFTGQFQVSDTGTYNFSITHDDGFIIFVDGEAALVADYITSPQTSTGSINLSAGLHDVEIYYWDQGGDYVFAGGLYDDNGIDLWEPANMEYNTGAISTLESEPLTIDVLANDFDVDGNLSILSWTDGSNGVVTQSGNELVYTPNGIAGYDEFTYTVQDAEGLIDTATVYVRVLAEDSQPQLDLDADNNSGASGNNYQATITGAEAVAIVDGDVQIVDADSQIYGARIQLENAQSGDAISHEGMPGDLNFTYYAATHTAVISGEGSEAEYEQALESVRFSSGADTTTREFSITVTDEFLNSEVSTSTIKYFDSIVSGNNGSNDLDGTSGDDLIIGGANDDDLFGGLGADTFAWQLNDEGNGNPAEDIVEDFDGSEGDLLDLSDLLQGEESGDLTEYLHFEQSSDGQSTIIHISSTGGYAGGYDVDATDQIITLEGVSNLTGTDSEIINQLLTGGQLNVDQ